MTELQKGHNVTDVSFAPDVGWNVIFDDEDWNNGLPKRVYETMDSGGGEAVLNFAQSP